MAGGAEAEAAAAAGVAVADTTLSWLWWAFLVCTASVNVMRFGREVWQKEPVAKQASRRQVMVRLAAPYILQIAWRSVLPSEYPARITFFDAPINAAMVARLLAAVGEICFVGQLAAAITWVSVDIEGVRQKSGRCGSSARSLHCITRVAAQLLIILSVGGQCCATVGTATRNQFFFVLEGILWTALFALCTVVGGFLWSECHGLPAATTSSGLACVRLLCIGSSLSLGYMSFGYCPMCLSSWRSDVASGIVYLDFGDGFHDALTRRLPSRSWGVWRAECVWMSLYFVLGAWAATWLVRAPSVPAGFKEA